ncbi:hypothetical protein IFR05_016200 [Cadophora sp. M221]|nr:hypothetical protein IFR05_016200 [Cadophora sp. M221]
MASQLEFHPFPRLPIEIRLSIWGFVCKEPHVVSVVYFENIIGTTYIVARDDRETDGNECMQQFKFHSQIPSVLHVNNESRKHALGCYPLFFTNTPDNQENAYFNPNIDTCYVALANQSYEIKSIDAETTHVTPSDDLSHNQSWNLEYLGFATERLSRPKDLPNFPAVKFMAVDETFLQKSEEHWTPENWKEFFTYVPSLESFTFVQDGDTKLLSKGLHARNWKIAKIWESFSHPSVFESTFLLG